MKLTINQTTNINRLYKKNNEASNKRNMCNEMHLLHISRKSDPTSIRTILTPRKISQFSAGKKDGLWPKNDKSEVPLAYPGVWQSLGSGPGNELGKIWRLYGKNICVKRTNLMAAIMRLISGEKKSWLNTTSASSIPRTPLSDSIKYRRWV